MLRDRHPIDKLFEEIVVLIPKMDPVLAKIDQYLEDDELFRLVQEDFGKPWPLTLITGRNSTPVEVIERMLVVRRLYSLSYEETERLVSDSLILRQFCRVYFHPVPDDTTLIRAAKLIRPETLEKFNEGINQLAVEHKVTQGRKLRTDGTVVETNIHAPSDSWQARLGGADGKGDLLVVKNFLARYFSKIEVGYHTVRVVYTYPVVSKNGVVNKRRYSADKAPIKSGVQRHYFAVILPITGSAAACEMAR